jgi:hypothetical protein
MEKLLKKESRGVIACLYSTQGDGTFDIPQLKFQAIMDVHA